jgi:alkanesulfonate monooxygenase SsuD/methylene tetrahydromethanopterin reductase-like flavin-dependent oxidoreductase (luciferase family)
MILGLGSGTRSMNERWYSMPFDQPPAPRMKEAIALVRAAITAQKGGGLKFHGKYYKVDIPQYSRPGAYHVYQIILPSFHLRRDIFISDMLRVMMLWK